MKHNDIIAALEKNLPEINKTGDPEAVLLKYASRENLAPAQLERLGQAFNTAKTVVFLDKSASRAGSFSLLDVEGMMSKYASAFARPKAASCRESLRDWVDGEDFFGCSGTKAAGVGSLFPAPAGDAAEEKAETVLNVMKRAMDARMEMGHVVQAMEDFAESLAERKAKLASVDAATLVEDVYDLLGEKALRVLAGTPYAKHASSYDHAASRRRLSRDRTGMVPTVKAALEDLEMVEGARRYAAGMVSSLNRDMLKAADYISDTDTANKDKLDRLADFLMGEQTGDDTYQATEDDTAQEPAYSSEEAYRKRMQEAEAAAEAAAEYTASITPEEEISLLSGLGRAPGKRSLDDYDAALAALSRGQAATGYGVRDMLSDDWKGLRSGFKGTRGGSKAVGQWVKGRTDPVVDKGKTLLDLLSKGYKGRGDVVDFNEYNERGAMALQELMVTDPVISQYGDDEVVDVANAIKELNPAIMGNPVLLRTVLREALQYDSAVPMHVQSDLSKLYESIRKGREPGRVAGTGGGSDRGRGNGGRA